MNNRPASPTRLAIILTVIVTLILIIGSAVLNRIVFKAAEPDSNVYFNPSQVKVKLGGETKVDVLADITAPAKFVGAELTIKYDPTVLELISQTAGPNWQLVKTESTGGILTDVITANYSDSQSLASQRTAVIVTLNWRSLVATNSSSLQLLPTATIIAASSLSHSVYNSVATVQDATVTVSEQVSPAQAVNNQIRVDAAANQTQTTAYTSQRIISDETLLAADLAVVLVTVQQAAQVSVRFGLDKTLGNTVNSTTTAKQAVVKISGLAPQQRYYYQVVTKANNSANLTLGQVKSFQLPALSNQTKVDHAAITIFPPVTEASTTAFALLYDADGNVISDLQPKFESSNPNLRVGSQSQGQGLYQVPLTAELAQKAVMETSLSLDGQPLTSASFLVDPSLSVVPPPSIVKTLLGDQKTINLILALIGALILLGVVFYRILGLDPKPEPPAKSPSRSSIISP